MKRKHFLTTIAIHSKYMINAAAKRFRKYLQIVLEVRYLCQRNISVHRKIEIRKKYTCAKLKVKVFTWRQLIIRHQYYEQLMDS